LPVLTKVRVTAQKNQAKTEMQSIIGAIESYDQENGRFPLTTDEKTATTRYTTGDFTTGYVPNPSPNKIWNPITATGGYNTSGYSFDNNSNVVAILMDLQQFPNGTTTSNNGHVYNPKQNKYLNAKPSGYDPITAPGQSAPGGVDVTGVYRDPWGNPYVITMDTSYDDQTCDMFYGLNAVSGPGGANTNPGLVGLTNPDTTKQNNFQFHGKVMVWSAGPDGKADPTKAADADVNKDNILSWK
jgi:hypothetical protein